MGLSYRKSFKAGPIRVAASKSGISYSAGLKGARITKRADGSVQKTVSVPRTGARYITTARSKPKAASRRTAGRQQSVPKSTPLRGRRATIMPHLPPVNTGVLRFKGYLGTVTLSAGGIEIQRSRTGLVNGNRSSGILWDQLAGIDFLDPNIFRNGHIHFATANDPRGLSATGHGNRLAAAARNPHAIMFAWHQRRTYRELRALLSARAPDRLSRTSN
jgi:Protein of unknown function (DUF4236)